MHSDVLTNVKTLLCFQKQGPSRSVRTCDVDTVTHDTSVYVKDVTCVTLGVTFAEKVSRSEKLRTCGGREHPRHQSDFTFQALGSFKRTRWDSPNIASMGSSSIGILRPFLLFLRCSPLSVFSFLWRDSPQNVSCQRYPH